MADGRQVRIVISADVAQAIRQLAGLQDQVGRVGGSAEGADRQTSSWVDKFKTGIGILGVQTGWDAIKSGFDRVIGQGLTYEQNMNTLRAVLHASDSDMAALGERAKSLGNDITIPGASAGTAAEAMRELAKGGLDVGQTMQAAAGTLRLAAAAQVDGAQAAEIQANALNAFRLGADQADHVADLLANSANAASGEVTDMAAALQQSATVAHGFGISIDDSATTLALFARNGVLGSDAGTSFKTMLTSLASPTKAQSAALDELGVKIYDGTGRFVGMEAVTKQLAVAHATLTTEQYNAAASTAFGTDAIRAANILGAEGTEGWKQMAAAVTQAGGAQDLAASQSKGFTGALDRLNNAIDTAALTLYEKLAPALTGLADFGAAAFSWLGDVIGWFADLPGPVQAVTLSFGAMILLRGPLTALWTSMVTGIQGASLSLASIRVSMIEAGMGASTMQVGMMAASIGVRALGTALKTLFLSNPIGLALVGVTTALSFFIGKTDDAAVSQADFAGALDNTTGKLNDQAASAISAKVASSGLGDLYKGMGGNVADLVDAIGGIPGKQEQVNRVLDQAKVSAQGAHQAVAGMASGLSGGADASTSLSKGVQDANHATDLFKQMLGEFSGAQNQAQVTAEGLTGELGKQGSGMENAADKASPFGDALKGMRDAAGEADANLQFLSITLLELSGNQVPAEQRARANAAAFRDVGQAARDLADANDSVSEKQKKLDDLTAHLGGTLDGQAVSATNAAVTQQDLDAAARDLADAQAGVQNATDKQKDALDKAAQSARDMTATAYNNALQQGGLNAAIAAATSTMQQQRDQFIRSAVDAGISQTAAEQLADAQGLIPKKVETTYIQHGATDAQQQAKMLNDALDKINDRTVHYTVVGGQVTTEGTLLAPRGSLAVYADGGLFRGAGGPRTDSNVVRVSDGEFIVNAASTARNLPLLHAINGTPGFADGGMVSAQVIGDYASMDWTQAIQDGLNAYNKKVKDSLFTAANINYSASAGVAQWMGTVLQALMLTGQPASMSAYVLHQMQTESGGNPNAINLSDINAQRGIPSKGLMQVIDPTFRSYAMPGLASNIWDPLSNIVASIRYVLGRYGSIPAGMRGVAYENGGVLPPGFTLAYNGTGQSEHVFTRDQMVHQVHQGFSGGGTTYQGGQHGGIHIDTLNNNRNGDVMNELRFAVAVAARA